MRGGSKRKAGRQSRGGDSGKGLVSQLSASLAALLMAAATAHADAPIFGEVESVVTGNSFVLGGRRHRLWGIDAPDLDQPCVNGNGEAYACGTTAKILLFTVTRRQPLACRAVGVPQQGPPLVTCTLGGYDLGALMVASGYAFDDAAVSGGAYARWEGDAKAERQGMWGGPFVKPADWRRGRLGLR